MPATPADRHVPPEPGARGADVTRPAAPPEAPPAPPVFAAAAPDDPRSPQARARARRGRIERATRSRLARHAGFMLLVLAACAAAGLSPAWLAGGALLAALQWLLARAEAPARTAPILAASGWGGFWVAVALWAALAPAMLGVGLAAAMAATAYALAASPPLLAVHLGAAAGALGYALFASTGIAGVSAAVLFALVLWVLARRLGRLAERSTAQAQEITELNGVAARLGEFAAVRERRAPNGTDTLGRVHEAILLLDGAGRIVRANPAAERMLGRAGEHLLGTSFAASVRLLDPANRARAPDLARRAQRAGEAGASRGPWVLLQHGSTREFTVEVEFSTRGRGPGQLVVMEERSELWAARHLLEFHGSHDPLTGLLNRQALEQRYRALPAGGAGAALCYLSLSKLETINRICGFQAGDQMLRLVAQALRAHVRADDAVARLGGGKFLMLLAGCPGAEARSLLEVIIDAIHATGFPWQGERYALDARAGISCQPAATFTDALSAAAAAAHIALGGSEPVRLYDPADAELGRHLTLHRWMRRVQHAVDQGAFELLAQDIVPLAADKTAPGHHFVEWLVRLRDERGELVEPHLFMAAAEHLRLMPEIDRWVIGHALAAIGDPDHALGACELHNLNLSGQSLSDPELGTFILDRMREHAVPAERLCFEITETAVIDDLEAAGALMERLRAHGCRFAIDDFGSGHSSYAYLRDLPVEFVKIDGSFIQGLPGEPADRAVVVSINQLIHATGKRSIAEHVHEAAIAEWLGSIGVDFAQGTLYGAPEAVSTPDPAPPAPAAPEG